MWWWFSAASAVTLEEAWEAARTAPEVVAARADAERGIADVGAARAALLPKVVVKAGVTAYDQEVTLDPATFLPPEVLALAPPGEPFVVQQQVYGEASATLVLPLIDADAWSTLGAARSASSARSADAEATERQVRVGVARALYGTAMAREGVDVAEEAVRVAARQEEVARARVDAGDAPPRTALEAEQARLAAERDRLAAVEQQARAEEALHRWTGLPRDTEITLAELAVASTERPEIVAARERSEAARRATTAERLGWVPDVQASATALVTGNQGFAPDPLFLVGKVEATWTFDGGYRSSRVREARSAAAAAQAMVEAQQRRTEEEARDAEAALTRARAAAVAAAREQDAATARLEEAELAFQQGLIPFTELERASLGRAAAAFAESRERLGAGLAEVELALCGRLGR
ncbi:MAG: TolC family protein [Alphaproteobacteria bacterium]|nr:TolC family protein [Alphaproteobacteria bacterium]MCB9699737.1 TolC family protein [Alphaproteobacteria bacterium]